MYAQLLKELRQIQQVDNEYADKIEELEDRIEALEEGNGAKKMRVNNKKKKKGKKRLKRPEIKDKILTPWEREGFRTKKEWKDSKR